MRIYFMSICGTGMGNCALLMRSLGHTVLGADHAAYPPMSERLAKSGIEILEGYDAERLRGLDVDLVVVGNVNTRGNPEIEWLLETRSVPYCSLPELMSQELLPNRKSVVIAGTHGKTTTTTLTAFLLRSLGKDPGYFIGGVPQNFPNGAALGDFEDPFVLEGDEYDCAFFDKRSKFIHYRPDYLVLNNLEFDHADIFRDLADIERTFSHLIKLVPRNGAIIVNGDDPILEKLIHVDWAPVYRVGLGDRADLRISDFSENSGGSRFSLYYKGQFWGEVNWPVWGLFNARNAAMAAMAAALSAGLSQPTELPLGYLGQFAGVCRRQEILFDDKSRVIMVDFGHHPTAIRETLVSLRKRYPAKHLVMCFEARSNTACRTVHASEFELAFDLADEVHLGAVFRADRYSDEERIDLNGMAQRLGGKGNAHSSNEKLEEAVLRLLELPQDIVVIFFSNGSFDGIPQRLAERLKHQPNSALRESSALF